MKFTSNPISSRMNVDWCKSEPVVIDERILQKAVLEQLPHEQARSIAKAEGIHFGEILELHLQFRNIVKINYLREFSSLTRLELNNNLIEIIEGLDCLANLTWLNLSFNRIEKIEGLECLHKLEVLNLTNNGISVIENMDTLAKLTHFSIANNITGQLENVLYLRKFTHLVSLNLYGNPASKDKNYKHFIATHFPKLMFLDNRLLDKKIKEEASCQYVTEKIMQQEKEANQEAEVKLHTDAFVEFLNGSHLFDSMFNDPVAKRLHCALGGAPLLEKFGQQMVELCMQIFEMGLAEHKQRGTVVSTFYSGQTKAVTDCQQKASQILSEFDEQRIERTVELQRLSDPDLVKVKISHHNDEINQLYNSLMALEFKLVSQLEDISHAFDINISDMVDNFSETIKGIFEQCRDLEDDFYEKVKEIAEEAKSAPMAFMSDEEELLFKNKDKVMDVLATTHDNRLVKIRDREAQLVTRVNAWKTTLIKEIEYKAVKQNHMRISDILRYVDHLKKQLEEM